MGKAKAQSAMEFLMTYGWALLVLIVIFSALYISGVFRPQTVSRCSFGPEFACVSFSIKKIAANIRADFIIQHSQQQTISISEVSCVRGTAVTYASVPAGAKQAVALSLDPGLRSGTFSTTCYDPATGLPVAGMKVGDPFAGKIFVKWRLSTGAYPHVSEAQISGPAEPS
ncbi:MAG: hypothetical protein AB1468_03305 [Candidatus Micrarchaeota archaeon]